MFTKTITIDGREIMFRASAAIPRLYRFKFRRDIMRDIEKLYNSFTQKIESGLELDVIDLEIFENMAYTMALHADPDVPPTADEWLAQFSTFSIYTILPELLELWSLNMETQIESKKNMNRATSGR